MLHTKRSLRKALSGALKTKLRLVVQVTGGVGKAGNPTLRRIRRLWGERLHLTASEMPIIQ